MVRHLPRLAFTLSFVLNLCDQQSAFKSNNCRGRCHLFPPILEYVERPLYPHCKPLATILFESFANPKNKTEMVHTRQDRPRHITTEPPRASHARPLLPARTTPNRSSSVARHSRPAPSKPPDTPIGTHGANPINYPSTRQASNQLPIDLHTIWPRKLKTHQRINTHSKKSNLTPTNPLCEKINHMARATQRFASHATALRVRPETQWKATTTSGSAAARAVTSASTFALRSWCLAARNQSHATRRPIIHPPAPNLRGRQVTA